MRVQLRERAKILWLGKIWWGGGSVPNAGNQEWDCYCCSVQHAHAESASDSSQLAQLGARGGPPVHRPPLHHPSSAPVNFLATSLQLRASQSRDCAVWWVFISLPRRQRPNLRSPARTHVNGPAQDKCTGKCQKIHKRQGIYHFLNYRLYGVAQKYLKLLKIQR